MNHESQMIKAMAWFAWYNNLYKRCLMYFGWFQLYTMQRGPYRGNEVTKLEVKDFTACLEACDLEEMRSTGPYYSWINKTIWSRTDRVFTSQYWHLTMDFTQALYLSNGLSDHTPIHIQSHNGPKPRPSFVYCNMWSTNNDFLDIVTSKMLELK